METIDAFMEILKKLKEKLEQTESLINSVKVDIQILKNEFTKFKPEFYNELSTKVLLSSEEKEIRERLLQLRKDIQDLEKIKEERGKMNGKIQLPTSTSNISPKSTVFNVKTIDNVNNITRNDIKSAKSEPPPKQTAATEDAVVTRYYLQRVNGMKTKNETKEIEWWQEPVDEDEIKEINWSKEQQEREENKLILTLKAGWKKHNMSFKEMLRKWTGKNMKWIVVKVDKAEDGKTIIKIKFENETDKKELYNKRKQIFKDGFFYVMETLTHVEVKEKWKMYKMAECLTKEGKEVEIDNKGIRVDGEWWKYHLKDGWKKI